MNPFIKSALTTVGISLLNTTLAQAIKTLETKSSESRKPLTEDDIVPALKLRGSNEVYSDVDTLISKNKNQRLSVQSISLAILKGMDELFDTSKAVTIRPKDVVLTRPLEPQHLTEEAISKINSTAKADEVSGVSKTEQLESTDLEKEIDRREQEIAERKKQLEGKESKTTIGDTFVGHPTEPLTADADSESSIVGGAKKVIDYLNSQEKFHKIQLLVEKIDTSVEYNLEGELVSSQQNSFNRAMISTAVHEEKLVTLIHLYQDKQYVITLGNTDLINHLTTLCFSNKIVIQKIVTINTVKGEFTPSKKWVH